MTCSSLFGVDHRTMDSLDDPGRNDEHSCGCLLTSFPRSGEGILANTSAQEVPQDIL